MMFSETGTAACTCRVRQTAVHRRELVTAEEQPRRGAEVAGERVRVGHGTTVERDVARYLEVAHAAHGTRTERYLRECPTVSAGELHRQTCGATA